VADPDSPAAIAEDVAVKGKLRVVAAASFVLVGWALCASVFFASFPKVPAWLDGLLLTVALFVLVRFASVIFNARSSSTVSRGSERVAFDGDRITRTMRDGKTETVRWDELQEVGIVTTDQGPFVDDVFFVLLGETGGCAVPSDAKGMKELLARLQQLPGFDNEAVIKAMGSTTNAKFVCWRR
jgi:hypothetical protein